MALVEQIGSGGQLFGSRDRDRAFGPDAVDQRSENPAAGVGLVPARRIASRQVMDSQIQGRFAERRADRADVGARLDDQKHRLPRRAPLAAAQLRSAPAPHYEKPTAENNKR